MSSLMNTTFDFFDTSANFSNTSNQHTLTCDILENSAAEKIGKIIALSIILFFSLVGNTLIISIVYKRKELKKTMNYLIVNMAISDFVFPLSVIPFRLTEISSGSREWLIDGTTGLIFCKLKWFLQDVSVIVSVQNLVWITLDRFVAVVFPMKVHLISSRFRALAIASTWIVALIVNSLYLYAAELVEINKETICMRFKTTVIPYRIYAMVRSSVFYSVPLVPVTILYCIIAATLRRQDKTFRHTAARRKDQRKRRAVKMSACVMAAFFTCSIPSLIFYILLALNMLASCTVYNAISFFSAAMFYLSSTTNPIICMTFVQSYRRGLMEFFHCCWSERLTTGNMETGKQEGITLQRIRVIQEMRDNPSFSET